MNCITFHRKILALSSKVPNFNLNFEQSVIMDDSKMERCNSLFITDKTCVLER